MAKAVLLFSLLWLTTLSFCEVLSSGCNEGFLENVDFPGSDIMSLFSPSAEHCQQLCTQHHSCLFFTFIRPDWTRDDRHFYCYLKSTPSEQPPPRTSLLGVTSGFSLKLCSPDPRPCFPQVYENTDFNGADYRGLFTASHEECQRICTKDPACQFFTYIKVDFPDQKIRYKCHLKFSWPLVILPIVERKPGVTSGFSSKAEPIQQFETACERKFFPHTDIPGNDLLHVKAASDEHCQALCSTHPKCTYFSFSSTDFKCYLKNNENEMVLGAKQDVISGIQTQLCLLDDTWVKTIYDGVDFRAADLRFELLDDANVCRTKCEEDPNCQFFTYVDENFSSSTYWRRCYLKRVITMPAPPKVSKLAGVVSGFSKRNCLSAATI